MGDNKNYDYRLTLKFSPKSEMQMKAYEFLKQRGRKKSAFISEAVCYYLAHHREDGTPLMPVHVHESERDTMRAMIMEVLKEMNITVPQSSELKPSKVSAPPVAAKPQKKKKSVPAASQSSAIEDIEQSVNLDDVMDMLMGLDEFSS